MSVYSGGVNKEKFIGPIKRNVFSVAHLQQRRLKTNILVPTQRNDSIFVLMGIEQIFTVLEFLKHCFCDIFPYIILKYNLYA